MWAGLLVNIPTGWALCDGQNGTPDLRDRFIKGAASGADPGATGGAATHGHTTTQPADHAALTHSGATVGDHSVTQPGDHTMGAIAATGSTAVKVGTSASNAAAQVHTHAAPTITSHDGTAVSIHSVGEHPTLPGYRRRKD